MANAFFPVFPGEMWFRRFRSFHSCVSLANLANESDSVETLPSIWARMKIADLAEQATYSRNPFLPGQIKRLALDYPLMSAYTAFVALDSSARSTAASMRARYATVGIQPRGSCRGSA